MLWPSKPNLDDVDHTFYGDKPILEFSRFQSWNTMEARVRLIFIININTISDIIFLTSGKIFTKLLRDLLDKP